MFTLIVTVVAIALVAVLALATLYYGSSAYAKGAARAEAAKLTLQGQQLLGAADLYFTEHRAWPADIGDLVAGGYLKQVPSAELSGLAQAVAAGGAWSMPQRNTPMFIVATQSAEVCAEVNRSGSLARNGVLRHAFVGLAAQCFGDSEAALQTVFKKSRTTALVPGLPSGQVLAGLPGANALWLVEPTEPGGSLPPVVCTEPAYTTRILTDGYDETRLGIDQFLDPPGWYDGEFFPFGRAYELVQTGTTEIPCP